MRRRTALILILAVTAPLLFVNLGGRDFWAPDEPRFAQIAREMVRSGDWIVPRMNGQNVALLPPMTYWLVALPSALHGDVTEFTARLPMAVMGLIGVLATFTLGRRMYGTPVGVFSAVILATSFKYLWQARWLQADMPLTAFTTLAILFFYCGFHAERRKWVFYHLFCAAMGLAVLSKGPLGVVLPGLVILPYLTFTRNWGRVREMHIPTGILLFLAIVLPWYLAVGFSGGRAFLREVVIRHNFGMFFHTWSHKKPVWFYLPHVFWLTMPWALFLFPALVHIIRQKENREQKIFLVSWMIAQFVFFTASDAKQEKYLLPLLPAVALITGKAWADYIAGTMADRIRKTMAAITLLTAGVLLLVGLVGPIVPAVLVHMGKYTADIERIVITALPITSILIGAAIPILFILRKQTRAAFVSLVVLCVGLHLYRVGVIMPEFNLIKSARGFCTKVKRLAAPGEPIGIFGIAFRQTGAYLFYTDRPLVMFENEESQIFERGAKHFSIEKFRQFFESPRRALCIVKDQYLSMLKKDCEMPPRLLLEHKVGHRMVYLISNEKGPQGPVDTGKTSGK
ncbi:MAG: glycosyltransferase family 39 protein [Planctomycetes bacterium]|nr:glycosyltransferase family 39 protein [Planctomycetota bacterium]